MARKGNPISVRLDLSRSSDSSWFSDYYYGKFVYQDLNQRSYLGSIRPPTRLTFGFRLGRCIILHFPKRTLIHFFLPRRARRLKRHDKSRPGKAKGQWLWELRKVFRRMSSNKGTEEAGDRAEGKRGEESIRLDDREKQKGIRIWPKKMQRYGYHDQAPSIKEKLRALNPDFYSIFPYLQKSPPSVSPSYLLNYFVTQYFFNNIKKMHFNPFHVLNHFVASGVAEPGGAKEESNELRIRSRIAFFVESSTCGGEKKYLAQAKKGLIYFIRQANDLRFAGTRKNSISLFPFFVATFFFPREDPIGVPSELRVTKQIPAAAKKKLLKLLRKICLNLMGQNKVVMEQIEKFIDLGRIRVLRNYISLIIKKLIINLIREKLLRKGRVQVRKGGRVKGCNKYNYDVTKMRSFLSRRVKAWCNKYNYDMTKKRSFLSNRTQTNTFIFSVKIPSFYQSASLIAKEISVQTRKKQISFRSIYRNIVKGISLTMQKGVVGGIRISCSGRLRGAEIARTFWGKYGKTSCNVLHQKIDYGTAKVCTKNGILGVKVRISYS